MKFRIKKIETVSSTNDYLKELAEKGAVSGTVVWAKKQTSGKGRWRRHWFSPEGSLFFSILLKDIQNGKSYLLQLVAAVAVVKALSEIFPEIKFGLKWPNDILVSDKKIGGILLEGTPEYMILGIGINVNASRFPLDLRSKTASLQMLCGKKQDLNKIFKKILDSFVSEFKKYQQEGFSSILKIYREYWVSKNSWLSIVVNKRTWEGLAMAINSDGYLVLETKKKKRKIIQQGETEFVSI